MAKMALVTGSRVWSDYAALEHTMDRVAPAYVMHGQAQGADALASKWCQARGVPVFEVPALWHAKGRAAGPLRNALMVEAGIGLARTFNVELVVVAFPKPGSKGTIDMIHRAERNNLRVGVCMAGLPTSYDLNLSTKIIEL